MNTKTMRYMFLSAAFVMLLSGCLSVYRAEIQQGNVVTQEMVNKLKPGMTRNQVRFVLGTPLVIDPFHPDRWDYYYSLQHSKEKTGETQRVTVIFKNDTLLAVQGDVRITSDAPKTNQPEKKSSTTKPAAPIPAGHHHHSRIRPDARLIAFFAGH